MSKASEALEELKMWATNGYFACKPSECDELAEPIKKELETLEQVYQIIEDNADMNDSETLNKIYDLLKEVLL